MRNRERTNKFTVFSAAICCKAKIYIRQRIKAVFNPRHTQVSLERVAVKLNPKIRGWLNYYCRYNHGEAEKVFVYLNELIRRWVEEKYRLRSWKSIKSKYDSFVQANTGLFVHWQKGVIPHDVPWGTGISNIDAIIKELKRQNFKGLILAEYEWERGKNTPEIMQSVINLRKKLSELK